MPSLRPEPETLLPADRADLERRGISDAALIRQLRLFSDPPPAVTLARPCRLDDGIVRFDPARAERYYLAHADAQRGGRCMKFVPASGAATRMFKALLSVRARLPALTRTALSHAAGQGDGDARAALEFVNGLHRFAFFPAVSRTLAANGLDAEAQIAGGAYDALISCLLDEPGLGCAARPKGLLDFHRTGDVVRTPFEEQLVEAAACTRDAAGVCRLHLTVSADHLPEFVSRFDAVRARYEADLDARFETTFSTQRADTDTVAVDRAGVPVRDADGRLVLRPGGHGALLANLNDLRGDVVFVKNIDNVAPDHLSGGPMRWKRVLGGCLVTIQQRAHAHLRALHAAGAGDADLGAALAFLDACGIRSTPDVARASPSRRRAFAIEQLDRPIRVCGMVRNTGEPGGGPYWVVVDGGAGGTATKQIVESAQVDRDSADQRRIFDAATHFNPVDLVCGVRDWRGAPFDLTRYTDPDAVFISEKSIGGRPVQALEHPGLWNGGMARWISLFVEVPPETFTPVKTVNDLLRPEHQPHPTGRG